MTNKNRRLFEYLMSGGLEGVRFRFEDQERIPPISYDYTIKSVGRGRGSVSLWIDTPSDVETGSREKRVTLYDHLCDIAIG